MRQICRIRLRIFLYQIYWPVDPLLQRDESLRSLDARYFLNFIVQHLPKVIRIFANYFYKNTVQSRGVICLHNLRYGA